MKKMLDVHSLAIDSTVLCCNFVNTVYPWQGGSCKDYLENYGDVITWCRKLKVYRKDYLDNLSRLAERIPSENGTALAKIKEVRSILQQFISSIAAKNVSSYDKFLAAINPLISIALSNVTISYRAKFFTAAFQEENEDLLAPLWPVLRSLYEMITASDLNKIKQCPGCGWVFVDETKNGRRRWCNAAACGSRDKMLRYNQKRSR